MVKIGEVEISMSISKSMCLAYYLTDSYKICLELCVAVFPIEVEKHIDNQTETLLLRA